MTVFHDEEILDTSRRLETPLTFNDNLGNSLLEKPCYQALLVDNKQNTVCVETRIWCILI